MRVQCRVLMAPWSSAVWPRPELSNLSVGLGVLVVSPSCPSWSSLWREWPWGLAAGNPGSGTFFPFTVGNLVFLGVYPAQRLPRALLRASLYLLSHCPPHPPDAGSFSSVSGYWFCSLGDSTLGSAGVMETPQPCPSLRKKEGKTFGSQTNRYFL